MTLMGQCLPMRMLHQRLRFLRDLSCRKGTAPTAVRRWSQSLALQVLPSEVLPGRTVEAIRTPPAIRVPDVPQMRWHLWTNGFELGLTLSRANRANMESTASSVAAGIPTTTEIYLYRGETINRLAPTKTEEGKVEQRY